MPIDDFFETTPSNTCYSFIAAAIASGSLVLSYVFCPKLFSNSSGSSLSQSICLSELTRECSELIETQKAEIDIIQEIWLGASVDLNAAQRSQNHQSGALRLFDNQRLQCNTTLVELLSTYPTLDLASLDSSLELERFIQDRITHHSKVKALVERYLPEAYATIIASKSENFTASAYKI